MRTAAYIIDVTFKLIEWLVAFLFSVMTVLVFMQVIGRYVLNSSLTWSEEIVNYSMIWITMLGACLLMRNNGHMAIDNFVKAWKGPFKTIALSISVLLQIAFIIVMEIGILKFLPVASAQFSPVLHLNMGFIYSIFAISGGLMLLGLADHWIVHKGKSASFSEEDALLKQVRAENQGHALDGEEA